MQFFRRTSSTTTPTSPGPKKPVVAQPDPVWSKVLEIKGEVLKAWVLPTNSSPLPVPEGDVGFFRSDEMYVVLKTSNHNKKLVFDLFFWIGKDKATKMVPQPPAKVGELMNLLEDNVVLHREIGGSESLQFKALFKEFGVLSGNLSGAFDPDHPELYKRRLLHFCLTKDKKCVEVTEVPISRKSLFTGDVYILDEGIKMTQWNGSRCDDQERMAARKYINNALKKRKTRCTSEFLDEEDLLPVNEFTSKLGNADVPPRPMKLSKKKFEKTMLRLTDESKKMLLNQVYKGKIYRNGINPDDITLVDSFRTLYVYIGPGANATERANIWPQATKYLADAGTPNKAIAVFVAGCHCNGFEEVWDDL